LSDEFQNQDPMNPILRNILAVIVGAAVAMVVNDLVGSIGGKFLPIPEGIDPNDLESIKANIDLYTPIHFIAPFLAHALGTLGGAIVACLLATSHRMTLAMIVSGFHFMGGITMCYLLSFQPLSFSLLDLAFAYFPMAYIGVKIVERFKKKEVKQSGL
jgi:hypothetical protein